MPRPLYPRERNPVSWVGPIAGLDRCGKSRPQWESISGPSSLYRVAVPSMLSRPFTNIQEHFLVIYAENVPNAVYALRWGGIKMKLKL